MVEHKFERVFVSPFKRTMETARLMIEQFPYALEVIEDERLREIDFGVLDGLTKHGITHFTQVGKPYLTGSRKVCPSTVQNDQAVLRVADRSLIQAI